MQSLRRFISSICNPEVLTSLTSLGHLPINPTSQTQTVITTGDFYACLGSIMNHSDHLLNFLQILRLASVSIGPPGYNLPISQEGCKGSVSGTELSDIYQLVLWPGLRPGHSKLKLLRYVEIRLPIAIEVVTCCYASALVNESSIHQDQEIPSQHLPPLPDFSLTFSQDPPDASLPQDTTWPPPQMAANAEKLAARDLTSFSRSFTALQSPPYFLSPQDITVPSLRIAANARPDATISVTSFRKSLCPPKALPKSLWPQVTSWLQNTSSHILYITNIPRCVAKVSNNINQL